MSEETTVRVVTIVCLTVLIFASIAGLTVTAVLTDRDLWRAEVLTFAGTIFIAALGGISWVSLWRRHRWHVQVDRNGTPESTERPPQGP